MAALAARAAAAPQAQGIAKLCTAAHGDAFRSIVHARRSVKRFDVERQIPQAVLTDILQQMLRAPSGFNMQPYTVVLAQSEDAKAALSDACLGANGRRVRDAPVTAVFAADLQALRRIDAVIAMEREAGAHPGYLNALPFSAAAFASGPLPRLASLVRGSAIRVASALTPMPTAQSPTAWAYKQTAIAATTLMLAATAQGLGSCAMEGFDSHRVARALNIPSRYEVPLLLSLGFPHAEDVVKESPRFALGDMVRQDDFAVPFSPPSPTSGR